MTSLSSALVTKIGKLLPLLGSDKDGEVVATARALVRTLEGGGADLHDVVSTLSKPPKQKIVYRDRVVYRDRPAEPPKPEPRPEPEFDDSITADEVMEIRSKLLDPQQCELKAVEAKFVRNMYALAARRKKRFQMTVKQAAWLRRLADEHLDAPVPA